MSVLTKMAENKVAELDRKISERLEYLSGLHGEVKAAEEDIEAWRTDRDEFADFLAKQGIKAPEPPVPTP
jgi:SMC interacting uncharacterized protein involved in chromosome segregation